MWCWCGCQMGFWPYLVGFQWWCACVFWFPNDFLQEPHNIPTWLPIKNYQHTTITPSKHHQNPKNGSVPPNMAATKTNWFPFNPIKTPSKSYQNPKNGSVPPNMAVTKTNWFPFNTIKTPSKSPKSQEWVSATKHGCKLKPIDFHSTPPKPQNPTKIPKMGWWRAKPQVIHN